MTGPTFLIIGAGRSGTTSLDWFLDQHPDVFMCPVKETNYFAFRSGDLQRLHGPGASEMLAHSIKSDDEYAALFAAAAGARAVGEVSPSYLARPGVPATIRRLYPAAKLVAILRHPAERAYAAFMGLTREGLETESTFEAALAQENRRREFGWAFGAYVEEGRYARHIRRYLDIFPRDQIQVFLYDDLVADAGAVMRALFGFVGVDPDFEADTGMRHNRSGIIRNPLLRMLWTGSRGVRSRLRPYIPAAVRRRAFPMIAGTGLDRPEMAPETYRRLSGVFRDDIEALGQMLDRDMSNWLA